MRLRRSVLPAVLSFIPLAGIAAAAIPGPQRMVMPTVYGMHEIAPNVFIDDVAAKDAALHMVAGAEQAVTAFFGALHTRPRYILCTGLACSHRFGETGNVAKSLGWSAITIPKKAFDDQTTGQSLFTHELVHSELLYRWGATALYDQRIPNWFNEGLATWVAKDTRVSFAAPADDKTWITQSRGFWDWSDFVNAHGWARAYGAAASNVADIHAQIGLEGLRKLISRSLAGEAFDTVRRELTRG